MRHAHRVRESLTLPDIGGLVRPQDQAKCRILRQRYRQVRIIRALGHAVRLQPLRGRLFCPDVLGKACRVTTFSW
jgi:hypothetical protein